MRTMTESKYLGGQIVGLGKVHKDGSEEFNWLEKPIHNRITSVGLDHMLCYNGQTSGGITFGSSSLGNYGIGQLLGRAYTNSGSPSDHWGVLNFCAIGTDGTSTSFNDTALKAMVGTYTSNHKVSSTAWYKGTRRNGFGNWIHRVTYTTNAVESDTSVREVGIFGRYGSSSNYTYVLFARIVLDTPLELLAGEAAIITYELRINNYGGTIQYHDSFFGLKDPNGNDLKYAQKLYRYDVYTAGNDCYNDTGEPNCGRSYEDSLEYNSRVSYNYYGCYFLPPYCSYKGPSDDGYSNAGQISYSQSSSKNFPTEHSSDTTNMNFYDGKINNQLQFVDYTGVGTNDKYRDFKIIWGPMIPSTSEYIDIYYLRINGMDYRFGYLDEDGTTWVPQAFRKYNNQTVTFVLRTRYVTEDTVQG